MTEFTIHTTETSPEAARPVLDDALERNPGDRDLLTLGISMNANLGRTAEARAFAERLLAVDPGDPDAQAALLQLGGGP